MGWAGYAEYRVGLDPSPYAEAIVGPIAEVEASMAFLLSVLPRALPFFDLEPLHGASVGVGEGALVLLGPAGAGKSSLAAALDWRGHCLMSDDACSIDGSGFLWPGPPLLNPRWSDARQPIIGTYNGKHMRAPLAYDPEPRAVTGVLSLAPRVGADLAVLDIRPRDAFARILGNVRSPEALVERRRRLQLNLATMLSELPAAVIEFDPQSHSFELLADAVQTWSARLTSVAKT